MVFVYGETTIIFDSIGLGKFGGVVGCPVPTWRSSGNPHTDQNTDGVGPADQYFYSSTQFGIHAVPNGFSHSCHAEPHLTVAD